MLVIRDVMLKSHLLGDIEWAKFKPESVGMFPVILIHRFPSLMFSLQECKDLIGKSTQLFVSGFSLSHYHLLTLH